MTSGKTLKPRESIKDGILWLGSASVVMRSVEVVSNLVVWWFLTKEELGLAALSWSVAVVLEAVNGLGVGTALIQAKEVSRKQLDALFCFSVLLAVLLVGVVTIASPWIARFFGDKSLQSLIKVSTLRLLFMAVALVPLHRLIRELRFREVATLQIAALGLAAAVRVGLATAGFGAWALVIAHSLEGALVLAGVYLIYPFWPRFSLAFSEIREMILFGIKVAVSGIIYHGYRNLDYFIVMKFFGKGALGIYKVAFEVAMLPARAVLDVLNRSAFPVYSRIQANRAQLTDAYLWMTRSLVLLIAPITVFLFLSANDLFSIIAAGRWYAATPVVKVLCWAALLRCLAQLTPQLLHAAGRPDLAIYDSIVTFLALTSSFSLAVLLLGEKYGFYSIALAWLVSYPLILFVLWAFARTLIPLSLGQYLASLRDPALLVLFLLVVATPAALISDGAVTPWAGLTIKLTVVLISSVSFVRFGLRISLQHLIPRRIKE